MTEALDPIETLLAHLICADAKPGIPEDGCIRTSSGLTGTKFDAGCVLGIQPMAPKLVYTSQIEDEDAEDGRLYAADPAYLLHSVQDTLGKQAEVALIDSAGAQVKWIGVKKLWKRPRGIWVAKAGADLYEYHYRVIRTDGADVYAQRVAAVDKAGNAVPVVIQGSAGNGSGDEGRSLIMTASLLEDCRRPGVFQATVTDSISLRFPVPAGEHKELFKLRDGPYTGSRRRPIIHWVSQHLRKRRPEVSTPVTRHLRGVHQFTIDGLSVTLDATT